MNADETDFTDLIFLIVGQFGQEKPGFSEKAGLLNRKLTHYHFSLLSPVQEFGN